MAVDLVKQVDIPLIGDSGQVVLASAEQGTTEREVGCGKVGLSSR